MTDLERIIRPIVEGQIRGFLKEHPKMIEAVDWYRAEDRDPAKSFVGSLSKRIVRDLTCGTTAARLAAALLARPTGAPSKSTVASWACGDGGATGTHTGRLVAWKVYRATPQCELNRADKMSSLQTYAIGSFMMAASHYVHDAESFWWVAWFGLAVAMTIIHRIKYEHS